MRGEPYVARKVELDKPFDLNDGWVYFTTGGDIVREREGNWEICAQLKERINAVSVTADGSIACVGDKGVLHRWNGTMLSSRVSSRLSNASCSTVAHCRLARKRSRRSTNGSRISTTANAAIRTLASTHPKTTNV